MIHSKRCWKISKKEIENFDVILIMSNKDSEKISEPIIDLIKSK